MQNLFLWNLFLINALAAPYAAKPTCFAPGLVCDGNTAANRSVWCDYDLQTDWYTEVPNTGVTVEVLPLIHMLQQNPSPVIFVLSLTVVQYWFNIINTTAAPDGIERMILAVNGSVPGPAIEANWGDTVGKATPWRHSWLTLLHSSERRHCEVFVWYHPLT